MTDQEKIQYHAARRIWPKRNRSTPSGKFTWAEWFERRFEEPLFDYRTRVKREHPELRGR